MGTGNDTNNSDNRELTELVAAIKLLAKSHENEMQAVKDEHKDLRVIVQTQAEATNKSITELTKSTHESIKTLTESMHEMSRALQESALKSQHNHTQSRSEISHVKSDLNKLKNDYDETVSILKSVHLANNDRDHAIDSLKDETDNLKKSIEKGFYDLEKKISEKGKWWSDNWSKIFTVALALGSVVWGLAMTISKAGVTP